MNGQWAIHTFQDPMYQPPNLEEVNEEVRRNHGYTPSEVEALTQTFRALDLLGFNGAMGEMEKRSVGCFFLQYRSCMYIYI